MSEFVVLPLVVFTLHVLYFEQLLYIEPKHGLNNNFGLRAKQNIESGNQMVPLCSETVQYSWHLTKRVSILSLKNPSEESKIS